MNYERYIKIAESLRPREHLKYFHVTFAFYKNKLLKTGVNNYQKMHPYHRFGEYQATKSEIATNYKPCLHSEIDVIMKLGIEDCGRITFLNIGLSRGGNLVTSRPCKNCMSVLTQQTGYKKIVYYDKRTKTFEII